MTDQAVPIGPPSPSARRPAFRGSYVAFAVCVLLVGAGSIYSHACNTSLRIGEAGIGHFHALYNAGEYGQLYDEATPMYKRQVSKSQFEDGMRKVKARYGMAQESRTAGFVSQGAINIHAINVVCDVVFEKRKGRETFTWRVGRGNVELINYSIQAQ